jgi:hypothetical protein
MEEHELGALSMSPTNQIHTPAASRWPGSRLWRTLVAACALCLLVGCGSVANASTPTTTTSNGDPINLTQAAAVVRQHFDTLAAALQTRNQSQALSLLGEVDAGPAFQAESALVVRFLENGLSPTVDTSQAVGSIYLAHQNHYPASFLALAPTPLVDSSGARQYYVSAFEQAQPGTSWKEVLYALVGQSSGRLTQITVGSDGYSQAAPADRAVGPAAPAALSGAYATYLRDTVAGRPAPAQPAFAAGANTSQYAQSIQQESAYYTSVNVDSKPSYAAYGDYGPFTYMGPGGEAFSLFGTQETYRESTGSGLCMDQPPQQTWFGQRVPAGSYRSVTLHQVDMVGAALAPGAPVNALAFTAATTGAQTQSC